MHKADCEAGAMVADSGGMGMAGGAWVHGGGDEGDGRGWDGGVYNKHYFEPPMAIYGYRYKY